MRNACLERPHTWLRADLAQYAYNLAAKKKLEDRWATQHLTAIMKCQGGCAYGKRKHCGARQLLPANSHARKRSLAHQTRPCASLK